jgi:transcription antitermination factor NusG
MLVVTPQPHLQPQGYFTATEPLEGLRPLWAVHTKPRSEKKLTRFLESMRVGHYLPTMLRRHTYGGRQARTNWVPLFPGYVFLLQEQIDRSLVFRSGAVVQLISVPRPEELFSDLQSLWLTLSAKPASVREALYQPGVPVEVVAGPLKGVVGELIRTRKGGERLLICVHLFNQAVTVEIDAACVRRRH